MKCSKAAIATPNAPMPSAAFVPKSIRFVLRKPIFNSPPNSRSGFMLAFLQKKLVYCKQFSGIFQIPPFALGTKWDFAIIRNEMKEFH